MAAGGVAAHWMALITMNPLGSSPNLMEGTYWGLNNISVLLKLFVAPLRMNILMDATKSLGVTHTT